MHHYANRAMVGVGRERVNVGNLHEGQQRQQQGTQKGSRPQSPISAALSLRPLPDLPQILYPLP